MLGYPDPQVEVHARVEARSGCRGCMLTAERLVDASCSVWRRAAVSVRYCASLTGSPNAKAGAWRALTSAA